MSPKSDALTRRAVKGDVLESVLDRASAFICRYVVLSLPEAVAVTGWVAHTHAFDHADVSPYLAISSPELRSGKTRLLEVLELLVPRPWRVTLPTAATLFRKIDATSPTLLLDEADAIWGAASGTSHEALRAVLNSGHRRGATVPRVETIAGVRTVVEYGVFGPKALAGIGRLPTTVADRSINIRLNRRLATETVERFRFHEAQLAATPIRNALAELAEVDMSTIRPSVPESLVDRAAEAWEPLLVIAEAVGGPWPQLMRKAAVILSSRTDAVVDSLGTVLLRDLRTIFDSVAADRLTTSELIGALHAIEESPWATTRLQPCKLASLLREHDVRPQNLRRAGARVLKGYRRADLEAVWTRWL